MDFWSHHLGSFIIAREADQPFLEALGGKQVEPVERELELKKLKQVAEQAVRCAGEIIRSRMGRPGEVLQKGSADYVTEVDKACERAILDVITSHFPAHAVLSEESPFLGEKDSQPTWIVDPLDGTTNFIHGFPMVSVSLAVSQKHKVLLGLVLDPLRDELFVAARGSGAFLNGRPIRVRGGATVQDALMATGFPHRAKHYLEPYMAAMGRVLRRANDLRRAGSAALDLAYVACGRLDGFWEPGLKPWDVAAGSLLVLEAGGIVTDFWGTSDYLLNGHILAAPKSIHGFLLEQISHELAPALQAKILRPT